MEDGALILHIDQIWSLMTNGLITFLRVTSAQGIVASGAVERDLLDIWDDTYNILPKVAQYLAQLCQSEGTQDVGLWFMRFMYKKYNLRYSPRVG